MKNILKKLGLPLAVAEALLGAPKSVNAEPISEAKDLARIVMTNPDRSDTSKYGRFYEKEVTTPFGFIFNLVYRDEKPLGFGDEDIFYIDLDDSESIFGPINMGGLGVSCGYPESVADQGLDGTVDYIFKGGKSKRKNFTPIEHMKLRNTYRNFLDYLKK
ncbi:MAG: hypothetical protein KKG75_04075 [Nanoarchaeota archaeon]|nr:hypothetical protein [Nanoarchaeota archaeon]